MAPEASKQDWLILGLRRGAAHGDVERAYQRQRALYEQESLATYSLLTDDERTRMLQRIDLAYRNITGKSPPPQASGAGRRPFPRLAAPAPVIPPVPAPAPAEEHVPVLESVAPLSTAATAAPAPAPPAVPPDVAEPAEPEPVRDRAPGAFLRYHRLCRGATISDVAHETKIRAWQLERIEDESGEGMPASVYVRGFVIQYARFLEVPNPEQLAAAYLQRMNRKTGSKQ